MRDRIFFPLAGLLVITMVFLALQPGIGRLPTGPVAGDGVNYDRIVIDGDYLNKAIAGGDAKTELTRTPGGGYVLEISAAVDALNDAPELGPHFRLAADIEKQFADRRIQVTVRVKPADQGGATEVKLNYSAGRSGESGWRTFALQPGYSDVTFEYRVPPSTGEQGLDYVAVRPVVPDKQRGILVERITLERLP